jgi:hypothetical protein
MINDQGRTRPPLASPDFMKLHLRYFLVAGAIGSERGIGRPLGRPRGALI